MPSDYKTTRAALHASHDRLVDFVDGLSPTEAEGSSYCSDWSIAQVLSHLGSGAEIGVSMFDAALSGAPIPGRESFEPVWEKWNARTPSEVVANIAAADKVQLDAYDAAPDSALEHLNVALFGRELDAAGLFAMRLGEHVLHLWDVQVMKVKDAALQPEGVEILIERTPANATRFARGERPSYRGGIAVTTSGPEQSFVLDLSGDDVVLASSGPAGEATLDLPAEALIRLLYGRLDAEHTPADVRIAGPVSLEELRVLFPGF